jgi:putative transcriptional regulator
VETPFFLAALPQLEDEEFEKSIVLVLEHDEEKAFGVIINKPLIGGEELPTQLVAEIKDAAGETINEFEEPLFHGGPVREETIFTLHNHAQAMNPGDEFAPGLFISPDAELFQDLLAYNGEQPIEKAFYLGCASWEKGQLDAELRSGTWLVIPFARDFLFKAYNPEATAWSEDLWKDILKHAGLDPLTLLPHGSSDFGLN